jgi:hypothetical protein
MTYLHPSFVERLKRKYCEPEAATNSDLVGSAFERFLADASIPLAVFHSRALGRDFILARDAKALEALTEADHGLPVLTFADCELLAGLGPAEIGAVLVVKCSLGPEVALRELRPAEVLQ